MARGAHERPPPRRRFDWQLVDFLGGAVIEALILAFLTLAVLTGR